MGEVVELRSGRQVAYETSGPDGKTMLTLFRNWDEFQAYLRGEQFRVYPHPSEPWKFVAEKEEEPWA